MRLLRLLVSVVLVVSSLYVAHITTPWTGFITEQTLFGPLQNKTAHYADVMNLTHQAEEKWLQGRGYLWMQHSRKAAGTSLCMLLRLNAQGGIIQEQRRVPLKRETCQIRSLGMDHNIKKKYGMNNLPMVVRNAMKKISRNFVEVEGSGVPLDIVSEKWNDFVFVSTLRHPVDRIYSSLRHDPGYKQCNANVNKSACFSKYVGTDETILSRCSIWIYQCHSNYFVRSFSGLDSEYTTDDDMLARAKKNFIRFSCVLLQENLEETVGCFRKLGMFRTSEEKFNVRGNIHKCVTRTQPVVNLNSSNALLLQEDADRIVRMNQVDIEFYNWARDYILNVQAATPARL